MTSDAKREAQIRAWLPDHPRLVPRSDTNTLLRFLDESRRETTEARAKISELGVALNDARAEVGRLQMSIGGSVRQYTYRTHEEIYSDLSQTQQALRAPVDSDVMAKARQLYDHLENSTARTEDNIAWLARALQAYGDERARQAFELASVTDQGACDEIQRTVRAEERARCEAVVNAVMEEQRRIADTRVKQAIAKAASLAQGRVYKHEYRKWPWYGDGNSARDSNRVLFCDALADEIRKLGTSSPTDDTSQDVTETAARIAESRGDPRMGRYIAGEIRKAGQGQANKESE